jgi:hypothetical protein
MAGPARAEHGAVVTRLRDALATTAEDLDAEGQRWALLGGLAVSAFVEPRFTRDIDLAVTVPNDVAAEDLVLRMQSRGYGVAMVLEQSAASRLATVRLVPPGETEQGVVIDVMFASSGIEEEICAEALELEVFAGLHVPVCRPGHLVALKVLARDDVHRPQDVQDIRSLIAALDDQERAAARTAVELITKRGFHRGRDIASDLDVFLFEDER